MLKEYLEFIKALFCTFVVIILFALTICLAIFPFILCMVFWAKFWWVGLILTIFGSLPITILYADKFSDKWKWRN